MDDEGHNHGVSEEDEMRRRVQECQTEIAKVLNRHHCHIVPYLLDPQEVGTGHRTIQISAAYGIVPLPKE